MLFLKQIQYPYDIRKCAISGEPITYGQFYYEDDEDKTIVKFEVYKRMQQQARADRFDYSKLQQAKSEKEYREMNYKITQKQNELKNEEIKLGKMDVKLDNLLLTLTHAHI